MKLTIKNRFGVAPNALLNDKNISLKAKGLYTYIQSKPEGWRFSVKRMAAEHKDSIDGISVAVKELEQHGYLQRNKHDSE